MKSRYYQFSSRLAFIHISSSQDDSIRSMFSTLLVQIVCRHWLLVFCYPCKATDLNCSYSVRLSNSHGTAWSRLMRYWKKINQIPIPEKNTDNIDISIFRRNRNLTIIKCIFLTKRLLINVINMFGTCKTKQGDCTFTHSCYGNLRDEYIWTTLTETI